MIKYTYEYRINKKGSECFRSDSLDKTKAKLQELKERKPNLIFTMQSRCCRLNKYDEKELTWNGKPAWSIWN